MSKGPDWDDLSCDEILATIADGPVFNPESAPRVRKKRAAKPDAPADHAPANEAAAEQEPEPAGAEAIEAEAGREQKEPPSSDGYAPQFSEEWLALGFARKYRRKLRYVKKWGAWMQWTGKRWAQEDTLLAYDLIRKECRIAAALAERQSEPQNTISDLSKAKTRGALEILARSDRRFAATAEQWDADDWLINTPAGIIDLRTGANIGSEPARYCTKITDIAPVGDSQLWQAFLDKVTAGDKELQAYIKRMCGYWLTGSIREHALFFIYGPGGNGKGVFLNTVSAAMGMYHVVSPAQTFAEQKNQRQETELARLNGARLVISQETEQGQYWAEARIKSLTGGDKIAARFMRGDYFEFDPKFKLCIVGNHKPQLRAVDDAMRRRFNLIPFDVRIAPEEKDPNLAEKLKAEYGGILRWMIEGCLEWQREGLNPPEKVLAATSEYLDSEDTIGLWLADMCITPDSYRSDEARRKAAAVRTVGSAETALKALFKSWKEYAEASNFPRKNNKFLGEQLANRGFKKGRDMRGAFFKGIRLKTQQERAVDGVDGSDDDQVMTQHDGDSLSTVYARTHTHAHAHTHAIRLKCAERHAAS
jgi:putative DNA primase/helicase